MCRGLPADGIVLRQDWLRAYDFTTDRGAAALNDFARTNDPFANLGKLQISVEVSSVIRASPTSFRVAWIQRVYENGSLSATERWTAILTVVIDAAARCRSSAQESAWGLRQRHQLVEGVGTMKPSRKAALPVLLLSVSTLAGCTIPLKPPPQISYDDEAQPAVQLADPAKAG